MKVEGQEEWENSQEDILIKQETIFVDCESSQSWVWASGNEEPVSSDFDAETEAPDPLQIIDPLTGNEVTVTPSSADDENENQWSGSQADCTCHSIHVKQNELLRKAVHDLSVKNTLLEDFIQLEFGEKFQKFLKKRKKLLDKGKGKTGKQINGKRSQKSDKVVKLVQSSKESEKQSKESDPNHHHRSKTTAASSTFHKESKSSSSSSSSFSSSAPVPIVKKELPTTSAKQFKKKTQESKKIETPKPQVIYPQHKITEIANYIANPLTDDSLMLTKDNPPPEIL